MVYSCERWGVPLAKPLAFQIAREDNVCTTLTAVKPGTVHITGQAEIRSITIDKEMARGHKIAVRRIEKGEAVIKYGVEIGIATQTIEPGDWVHLHNCKSKYDERSSTLDLETGAPTDTKYI